MKHRLSAALTALFVATTSLSVAATEVGGTYVTAGMMNISTDELDDLKTVSGVSVDDEDTAATFGIGYQYDKNISFEVGVISEYDVSASATTTSASSGTLNGKSYSILTGTVVTLKAKLDRGYTLGTKLSSSVNELFDIYGKAGMYFWDAAVVLSADKAVTYDGTSYVAGTEATLVTASGEDVYYGIGGSYKIGKTTSINADYMKLSADDGDGESLSLSVNFDL